MTLTFITLWLNYSEQKEKNGKDISRWAKLTSEYNLITDLLLDFVISINPLRVLLENLCLRISMFYENKNNFCWEFSVKVDQPLPPIREAANQVSKLFIVAGKVSERIQLR